MKFCKKYVFLMLAFIMIFSMDVAIFSSIKGQEQSLESFIEKNKILKKLLGLAKGVWAISFRKLIEEYTQNNTINAENVSPIIFANPDIFRHFYSNVFIKLPQNEELKNSFLRLRFIILENSQTDRIFNYALKDVNEPLYVDILKIFLNRYIDSIINARESETKKLRNNIIQLGRKLLVFEKNKLHEYIISNQKILEMSPFSNIFNTNIINKLKSQTVVGIINELKIEIAKEKTMLDRAKIASQKVQSYFNSIVARIADYYNKNRSQQKK